MKRRGCTGCRLIEPKPGAWVNNLCPTCTEIETRRKPEPEAAPPVVVRDATADRLRGYLTRMAGEIPGVWKTVDRLRALKGTGAVPNWEPWCFMPLAGSYAVVSGGAEIEPGKLPTVGVLGALAAWRVTQGIYRYDETLLEALKETPVTGDIPEDVLLSIPEWCVYIETPDMAFPLAKCHGFFAYLEHDANDGRKELRIVVDTGEDLLCALPVHLGAGLQDGCEKALAEAERQMKQRGMNATEGMREILNLPAVSIAKSAAPFVSLLLYLCAANAEITPRGPRRPRPQVKRTKDGPRIFPPDQPMVWEVGFRIGRTIRMAREAERSRRQGDGTHASPRPHIRRAHWHSFWTGEKAKVGVLRERERKVVLKWLPPIAVNVDEESEVIPTVHRVCV